MPKLTPISEVMTSKPNTCDVRDSLESVRDLLLRESIHHVPILEGKRLVGIISSRDLVRVYRQSRSDDVVGDEADADGPSVATTMQTSLITMRADEKVDRAIDLLADGAIHSVLVLDAGGELVGIATNNDLLEYLLA